MAIPMPFFLLAAGLGLLALGTKKSSAATTPDGTTVKTGPLPPDLQAMVNTVMTALGVDAQGNVRGPVTAEALQAATQVAGLLEQAGFLDAAKALRDIIAKAAKQLPPPAPDEQVPLPPSVIDPKLAEKLNRALQFERDPAKLRLILAELERQPNASEPQMQLAIQMLRNMIAQLEAAQREAGAIRDVDRVVTSPGQPIPGRVSTQPVDVVRPPSATRPTPITSPGQPIPGQKPKPKPDFGTQPVPEVPSVIRVPTLPVPAPLPAAKTDQARAAEALAIQLNSLETNHGFPSKAKGKEDKTTVKRFQSLSQLTQDGVAGPGVNLAMAKFVGNLPHVWYWPKSATGKSVVNYRNLLLVEAGKADAAGDLLRGQQLRASAARENGEGGVVGTVPPFTGDVPSITPPPFTSAPVPSLPSLPSLPSVPSLPAPSVPSPVQTTPAGIAAAAMVANILGLEQQANFDMTRVKGREDTGLIKDFQLKAGLGGADGKAGPGTFLAAAQYVDEVPLVLYWPQNANRNTVAKYREGLAKLATTAAQSGRDVRAASLRASAMRESGQGGIAETGPVLPRV